MALTPGTRIGSYEITAQIGVGGMGEVYRATDTNLDRQVAIKVLPEAVAADAERLARFDREAKTLAALNHLNIAAIYGLERSGGQTALVMELVEGPTLAGRIAHGPISVEEALPVAKQIAEALEAAHEQGIVHRDLKPANIKLRPDGTVKVLDFGLARAVQPAAAMSPGFSQSPTITTPAMTQAGLILGTAAYMSPEQARGKSVDGRADVWAFACVLFEMLTGRRAFDAEDISLTLSRVLQRDPDFEALPATVPPSVRQVLRVCLRKDLRQRANSIHDVRLALEGAFDVGAGTHHTATGVTTRRLGLAVALAVLLAAATGAAVRYWPFPQMDRVARFAITADGLSPNSVAVSPDGRFVAFVGGESSMIHVRSIDEIEARPLPGTDGASYPFWSADSRQIGFGQPGALRRIALDGGPPQNVVRLNGGFLGGSWNAEGVIVYASSDGSGIRRVQESGGDAVDATIVEDELAHGFPSFLPDGRRFLFTRARTGSDQDIWMGDLDNDEPRVLLRGVAYARYGPPGFLLFNRGTSLMAQPFDHDRAELTGEPVRLADGLFTATNSGRGFFDVSAGGVLAFTVGSAVAPTTGRLTWLERDGRAVGVIGEPGRYGGVSISPDGTEVAVHLHDDNGGGGIVIWSEDRRRFDQLTFDASHNIAPVWSPDGSRIVFASDREGQLDLYEKLASGGGVEELLLESPALQVPVAWGPDGVLFSQGPVLSPDLWRVATGTDRTPDVLLDSDFPELLAELSPDGRWLAYTYGTINTGRGEVRLMSYPGLEGPWRVGLGGHPRWAADGRELFFLSPVNDAMMAASVATNGETPEVGIPEKLFDMTLAPLHIPGGTPYDVSSDGRFLINLAATETSSADDESENPSGAASITVVLNWDAALR